MSADSSCKTLIMPTQLCLRFVSYNQKWNRKQTTMNTKNKDDSSFENSDYSDRSSKVHKCMRIKM